MALKTVKAIGLMSGTSLDGIDVALLDTNGETIDAFGPTYFRPYSQEEREIIEAATEAALKWNFDGVAPNIFAQAEEVVDAAHIQAVENFLNSNSINAKDINLVGYHGQTILHRPPNKGVIGNTLQLGNGSRVAAALKIDTVYDFRSNDVEHGGQGAPLAPVFHKALVAGSHLEGSVGVLNVGGVSNITITTETGKMTATDCGPGNGPLDSWMSQNQAGNYDKDGQAALAGTPDFALIERWLSRDFFQKPEPKSADRWDFDVLDQMQGLSIEDGAATLAVFAAAGIKDTLVKSGSNINHLVVCGGGRRNPAMMAALIEQNIGSVVSAEHLGWRGDDIEAQAFAFLAARHVNQLPLSYPSTTGVSKAVTGGLLAKI